MGSGKNLSDAYEDSKETLRLSKSRQKEIVGLLNSQKGTIDELQATIHEKEESEGGRDSLPPIEGGEALSLDNLYRDLEQAKRAYRAAHKELQLCKEEIAETQSLKKRAMATLLQTYGEYERRSDSA